MDGSGNTVKQGLCAGDILHAPWGYNMTHPDFYLVLEGAEVGRFARLTQIERDETSTGFLCGTAVPKVPHVYKGKVERKKVRASDASWKAVVKFDSHKFGYRWDGKPCRFNYCD
jgi:hypothetical protein